MKKFAAMFLSLVMVLSLAVPAFASDDPTNQTFEIEGTIKVPTINVAMPTSPTLILNPFGLKVIVNPRDETDLGSTDQILSSQMQIKNLSNIDIQVAIKAKVEKNAKADADMTIDNTAKAGDFPKATTKKVQIKGVFLVGGVDDKIEFTDGAYSGDGVNVVIPTTEGFIDTKTFQGTDTTLNTTAVKPAAANTLAPVDPESPRDPVDGGVLNFRFYGYASKVTTWKEDDTVNITLTFTFTPVSAADTADFRS